MGVDLGGGFDFLMQPQVGSDRTKVVEGLVSVIWVDLGWQPGIQPYSTFTWVDRIPRTSN